MNDAMKQIEAIVKGRVQGVSFRYHTRLTAERLGVVGWVANRRDGTVQVVAQADEETLQKFIDFLHQGSPAAYVDRVNVTWMEPDDTFEQFRVRWL